MKLSTIGANILIIFGYLLGTTSILSALTSMPVFWVLDSNTVAYDYGVIVGRVIIIILIFLLGIALIRKGRKIKAS